MQGFLIISTLLIVLVVLSILLYKRERDTSYLTNDLSNDYQRWTSSNSIVAAYIATRVKDEVRLDDYFQLLIYAILKRSSRAIDEKIRRMSTVDSEKSDASRQDKDTIFVLNLLGPQDAYEEFINQLRISGASRKQISEIVKYLP